MHRRYAVLLVLTVASASLAGCASDDSAELDIYVFTKPGNQWTEVNVVLASVSLLRQGAPNGTYGYAGAANAEWVHLALPSVHLDGGAVGRAAAALVGELDVPPGEYSSLQLEIASASGTDRDGAVHDATLVGPKPATDIALTVESGQSVRLDLRLDASNWSHHQERGWSLRPVLLDARADTPA